MKLLPKNLCKKLSIVNGVGVCDLKNCICGCWHCEHKDKCGLGFEKCQLKTENFREIPNVYTYYEEAIKSIEKRIQTILDTEDKVKIIGGLLAHRETEILH